MITVSSRFCFPAGRCAVHGADRNHGPVILDTIIPDQSDSVRIIRTFELERAYARVVVPSRKRKEDEYMTRRMIPIALGAVLALGLTGPVWAQASSGDVRSNRDPIRNPVEGEYLSPQERGAVGSGGTIGQGGIIPGDASNGLPDAPNANTGGRPNNPNVGPTDRSGNVPSDNR